MKRKFFISVDKYYGQEEFKFLFGLLNRSGRDESCNIFSFQNHSRDFDVHEGNCQNKLRTCMNCSKQGIMNTEYIFFIKEEREV